MFYGATLGHQVQERHKMVPFGVSCVCTISTLLEISNTYSGQLRTGNFFAPRTPLI